MFYFKHENLSQKILLKDEKHFNSFLNILVFFSFFKAAIFNFAVENDARKAVKIIYILEDQPCWILFSCSKYSFTESSITF